MTLSVEELGSKPEDVAAWDAFVASCPEATFFHRAGWKEVVENAFGHATHYLIARRGTEICGVLPLVHAKSRLFGNALISNGFCVAGGPAAKDDETHDALDRAALDLLEQIGASYLEYRAPARAHEDWSRKDDLYANFSRSIAEGEDDNLKQIPRKQRAVVRKALKNETLSFRIDTEISDFYRLYAESVRNLGTPVFGKRYFSELMRVFGSDCEILTVAHDGRPVSTVMSFYFDDKVMPYYTGSRVEARRLGANDLMYWHVMRHGQSRGARIFDFGRSKQGTGPYAFKKNWGFEPEPILHEFYLADGAEIPNVNPMNPKYQLMVSTWRRLPLPIANFVGPHIVKNIA